MSSTHRGRNAARSLAASATVAAIAGAAVILSGCGGGDSPSPIAPDGAVQFSAQVLPILNRGCNQADCHGTSNPGAGLVLTSWEATIAGSDFGEVLIPFRPDESHLITHMTGEAIPRMPLSRDPLPPSEIETLRRWIAEGARSDAGAIPYADSRNKVYVVNQGSDVVTVIDTDAMLVTRLIDIGVTSGIEAPHNVHVDRQGRYAYISMLGSGELVKIDVAADTVVARVRAGASPAHPFTSPDGARVYVTDWASNTLLAFDAVTLTLRYSIAFPLPNGGNPHGLTMTPDGRYLLSAHETGDALYRIEVGETADDAVLTVIPLTQDGSRLRPFIAIPDPESRYAYAPCHLTGDVRVIDIEAAAVVAVIPIGGSPISEGMSPDGKWLYVANWGKNAVDVIDTESWTLVATIGNEGLESPAFAHPHAAAFTADGRYAYITNENTNGLYPQHHPSETGGRDGNVVVIDVATRRIVRLMDVEEVPTGIASVAR